jgi:hypothetical protein
MRREVAVQRDIFREAEEKHFTRDAVRWLHVASDAYRLYDIKH